jgi:signal transduction histidine kinase
MGTKDTPTTILIIDDDEAVVGVTTIFLKAHGYDVISSTQSDVAEEIIKEHNPDIVLLDYMLPDKDGMTLLKEIRHKYPDTYFIFFTGGGSTEIAVEAMKSGATDYIAKPFRREVLLDRVTSVLKLRTAEMMNRRLLKEIEEWSKELEGRVKEKATELEAAYQQVLQSEKMAILGYLSTGMAHDIRNPLNIINLFLQILKDELEDDEKKQEYLSVISDNVTRINQILEKLLESSKRPSYQLKLHDINEIIKNTISLYEHQAFLQHVDIMTDLGADLPELEVDYNEIEQIFSNLIINSFYVLSRGGTITIKTRFNDGSLIISVSDDGVGITKKDLDSIFDPFFTTKETKKGSGLGLSVVQRVVKTYGGTIDVTSEVGKYTTFSIKLPFEDNKEKAG